MENGMDTFVIKEEAQEIDTPIQHSKKKRKRDADMIAEDMRIKVKSYKLGVNYANE